MFPKEFAFSSIIELMGEDVDILTRAETVDSNGNVTFTYSRTIDTRAWIREVGGYTQFWDLPGYTKDIDLAGCFYYNESIDIGDMVIRSNGSKYEVTEIIERKTGSDIDFKEVLLIGLE